jgi:hypothetical protein
LLPGAVAGAGHALDQVDDHEEHGSTDPYSQSREQIPRDGNSRRMCLGKSPPRRLSRRGWHVHAWLLFLIRC